MVRLGHIKPNQRMRSCDLCKELANCLLIDEDLFAKVVGVFENGMTDVKLYDANHLKRPIYNDLIKKKFYKKI